MLLGLSLFLFCCVYIYGIYHCREYRRRRSSSSSSSSSSKSSSSQHSRSSSPVKQSLASASSSQEKQHLNSLTQPSELPAPPVRRYYGRQKDDSDSSLSDKDAIPASRPIASSTSKYSIRFVCLNRKRMTLSWGLCCVYRSMSPSVTGSTGSSDKNTGASKVSKILLIAV